jgi:hypothetical protein
LRLARVNKSAKAADRYCKSSADRFAKRDVQYAVARDRNDAMPRWNRRRSGQARKGFGNVEMPGAKGAAIETFRGTGDVPGNEGVGEHVRTRFHSGFGPGEIAKQRFRTERRKPVSSAGPVLKERALSKFDPAV